MMSNKMFKFKEQQSVGDRGESIFLDKYLEYEKLDKKNDYDFVHPKTGVKVELKTDTYKLDATLNHFIERFSDDNSFKDGGPYRCKEKNTMFVYYHINDDQAFFYDPIELVKIVDANFKDKRFTKVRNGGYYTLGYKVPRDLLKPALLKQEKLK